LNRHDARPGYDDARDRGIARLRKRDAVATFKEAGQTREPVLGLFATPLAAIDALLGLRDALLRATIREYQSGRSDVWPTMLVVAFYPAINRLSRRIQRFGSHEPEEIRAFVIESFLSGARSLRRINDVAMIPVRLKTRMVRRAVDEAKGRHADRTLTSELVTEAFDRGRIEPFAAGRPVATPHPADEVLDIEAMTEALVAGAPAAFAAMDDEEPSLRRLTRVLRPDLAPADQERLYQRIKRRYLRQRADGADASSLPPWWRVLTDPKEDERRRR
jgi:hypothetical protein